MGIAERKKTEKLNMTRLILKAAMELFLDEGFERVTIRRIAEKIEYSPATIYLYFKNKDEILYALAAMGFEKLNVMKQELQSIKDPWQRLRRRGMIYIEFALQDPDLYDLMFMMRIPPKQMKEKKKWETGLTVYEMLKENVGDSIQAGYLVNVDVEAATFAFWSLVHGMASLIIRDRLIMFPKEHLYAVIEETVNFVMDSMTKKKK